jgi:hypothetical protein
MGVPVPARGGGGVGEVVRVAPAGGEGVSLPAPPPGGVGVEEAQAGHRERVAPAEVPMALGVLKALREAAVL